MGMYTVKYGCCGIMNTWEESVEVEANSAEEAEAEIWDMVWCNYIGDQIDLDEDHEDYEYELNNLQEQYYTSVENECG